MRFIRYIITLAAICLTLPVVSLAADNKVAFSHQPLTLAELPPPGRSITLYAYLKNNPDASLPVRAVLIKDGRMMTLDPSKAYRNEYDQATYEFKITSPVGEMNYQFVLVDKDGGVTSSTNYKIRRTCIPELSVKVEKPTGPAVAQINTMLEQAKGLEVELKTWEHAQKALADLKAALAALHKKDGQQ